MAKKINVPLSREKARKLKRGDKLLMTGVGVGINIASVAMVY